MITFMVHRHPMEQWGFSHSEPKFILEGNRLIHKRNPRCQLEMVNRKWQSVSFRNISPPAMGLDKHVVKGAIIKQANRHELDSVKAQLFNDTMELP
jgi:hypothetical protein